MKEIGKERKIAIAALIVAVLMLTVAFAAMSRTLKINGTAKVDSAAWDIRFTSAEMKSKKGDAREVAAPVIDNGGIDLTLKVGLRKPKDEITYEAVIENKGDIDAEIESIEYPELTEDQAEIIEFDATYASGDEISKSQEINAGEEKTVKIVIRYKDITDESLLAKEAYDIPLTFKINYIQKGESILFDTESVPGGDDIIIDTETESSPFKVTKNGVLIHYVRQGDETSVTVPAEVNGIKIRKIASHAFLNTNAIIAPEIGLVIGISSDLEEKGPSVAGNFGMNFMMIDDFINNYEGDLDFLYEYLDYNSTWCSIAVDVNSENPMVGDRNTKEMHYLKNIDLSKMSYLEEIGNDAFRGYETDSSVCGLNGSTCRTSPLENVIFSEKGVLTTIGESAFEGNGLTSLVIPESVITIENAAFYLSNNLTTVTVLGEPADRFDSDWSSIFDSGVTRN